MTFRSGSTDATKTPRGNLATMDSNHYRTLTLRTLIAVCLVALFIADSQAQTDAARINDKSGSDVDIIVQGALDSELQPLLAALEGKEQIQIAAWTFWRGRIGAKRVVVSRTEVGPINAVAATTLAIVNFKPKLIINQGTAGANDPELKIFDIVVGEVTVDYGAFRSSHADAGKGIDMSRWTPLHHRLRIDGKERKAYPHFAGDEEAMRIA